MPGIVGLITKMPRGQAEAELLRMVGALGHESFYTTGTWVDESLGVYAGWVARAGSFCDGLPLRNETGDTVLLFSGEEFPEPGTPQRLRERGHSLGPCSTCSGDFETSGIVSSDPGLSNNKRVTPHLFRSRS